MLGQTFYHRTIRKYVTLFGTLFNDLYLSKKDSNNNTVSKIKVPVTYGPKQKFLTRIEQDPDLDRSVAIQLPLIAFEMTGMSYDPARKLNTMGVIRTKAGSSSLTQNKMYNPVPYIFDFSVYLMVDNAEDGTQLLEQILPFFTPEFNVSVNIVTEMGLKLDVPIIINNASVEDTYDGDFQTRRSIIWTLNFTLKGFIYPDVQTAGKIIKSIDVSFRNIVEDNFIPSESDIFYLKFDDSSKFNNDYLKLENGGFIITENSEDRLTRKTIIQNINVTPDENYLQSLKTDQLNTNTQITYFDLPVEYDYDEGKYV